MTKVSQVEMELLNSFGGSTIYIFWGLRMSSLCTAVILIKIELELLRMCYTTRVETHNMLHYRCGMRNFLFCNKFRELCPRISQKGSSTEDKLVYYLICLPSIKVYFTLI